MAMAQWLKKAIGSLEEAVNQPVHSPPRKVHKAQASTATEATADTEEKALHHQSSWMQKALTSALTGFGNEVESELEKVRTKQKELEQNMTKVKEEKADKAEIAELRQQLYAVQMQLAEKADSKEVKRIEEAQQSHEVGQVSQLVQDNFKKFTDEVWEAKKKEAEKMQSTPQQPFKLKLSSHLQYSQTRVARMGRLGFDLSKEEIESAVTEVMAEARVDPESFSAVCGLTLRHNNKGSMAEMVFATFFDLDVAIQKIKARNLIKHGSEPVWLDRKKTREELRPGRCLKRAEQYLGDVLATDPQAKLEIVRPLRSIKISGKTVARVVAGVFTITEDMNSVLNEDQRQVLVDYANDTM